MVRQFPARIKQHGGFVIAILSASGAVMADQERG